MLVTSVITIKAQYNPNVQMTPETFNKGMLMNAGFVEVRSILATSDPICYIFHDVDMLPKDDRNMYVCSSTPRHVGAYINKFKYRYAGNYINVCFNIIFQ